MKVYYSDQFVLPLPAGHRFPMKKYSMLRERVAAAGICGPGEMRVPAPVTDSEVLTAHDAGYLVFIEKATQVNRYVSDFLKPRKPRKASSKPEGRKDRLARAVRSLTEKLLGGFIR